MYVEYTRTRYIVMYVLCIYLTPMILPTTASLEELSEIQTASGGGPAEGGVGATLGKWREKWKRYWKL